jgi:hypothetical protein
VIDRQHPESTAREARYRAVLVVLLTVVGAIAVVGGGVGMVLGAVTGSEEQHVAVSTSSEYRFLSGVWLVLGVALWWSLVRPASRSAVTRVVLIAAIGGGAGRLVSLLVEGWPGPFTVALAIELLALPVLLVWHVRSFKRAAG